MFRARQDGAGVGMSERIGWRARLREELQRDVEELERLSRTPHIQGFQLDVF